MFRLMVSTFILTIAAHGATAGIWSEPTGNAAEWVRYACDPCCHVTNLHATKAIRAKLFVALRPRETRIEPYQTETFNATTQCMKAGFGLEVRFAD